MDSKTYLSIIEAIKEHDCLKMIEEKFPSISHGTLSSIISLHYQKEMKSDLMINKYYKSYMAASANKEPPGIIVRISKRTTIGPLLMAKIILTKYLETDLNLNFESEFALQYIVNKFLSNTKLIKNKELAYEVHLCNLYDYQWSPPLETSESSLCQEYEIQLYKQISNLGIAFRDEEYLKKLGFDKPPDVILDMPVAIDGFIIHWIESKALFADYDVHKDYKKQYSSYYNRFGTGLVIYWYGYIDTVDSSTEKQFIVRDHLPTKIVCVGSG